MRRVSPPLLLPLLALGTALLALLTVRDHVHTSSFATDCEMTYSWPMYTKMPWSETQHSQYALYTIHQQAVRDELTGMPVLFIPGHMGSYRQGRSIARHLWDINITRFDVFAVDFEEEWTGVHGDLVANQAKYVNTAVRAILKRYRLQARKQHQVKHVPESVVVVAHSMGGVVARMAQLDAGYKPNSIQVVLGLGTPFGQPPFPLDASLQHVYGKMEDAKHKKSKVSSKSKETTLVVSIAGGHKDTTVHASQCQVNRMLGDDNAMVLLTSAMPHVGRSIDHLCLTWCHQLLYRVAKAVDAVVDPKTMDLIHGFEKRRDAIERVMLLEDGAAWDEDQVLRLRHQHELATGDGYESQQDYTRYGMWLPRFMTYILRAKGFTLLWMLLLVVLHILNIQIQRWQQYHDPSASRDAEPRDAFPSFLEMLHPSAHVPGQIKFCVAYIRDLCNTVKTCRIVIAGGVLGGGVLIELTRRSAYLQWHARQLLELSVLYAIAMGLLYVLALVLSLIRVCAQPVLPFPMAVARRVRLQRWIMITTVYLLVQFIGHVRDFELLALDSMPRCFALLVLGSVVVFLLHLLELGVKPCDIPRDHQQYRSTLFAFYGVASVWWVGKVVYFIQVVRFPPPGLTNDFVADCITSIVQMELYRRLLLRSEHEMLPLPPTAFFDAGDDDRNASTPKEKVTATNCPHCFYEDGGPGAVFIEYIDQSKTKRVHVGKETVTVGPTFRVVECDCVYRFADRREYCAFCTRSCRLCGGGTGDYMEAQRFQEYVEETKTQSAMHGMVVVVINIVLLYMLYQRREHLGYYATMVVTLLLIAYHALLRHPVETARLKTAEEERKQRDARRAAHQKKQQMKAKERAKQEQQRRRTAREQKQKQQQQRASPQKERSMRQQFTDTRHGK